MSEEIKVEKIRKVFLDDLPRCIKDKTSKGKCIDWVLSIKYKVKFIYDEVSGEIEIIDYKNSYLYIKYLDKPIFKIHIGGFANCQLGTMLGKKTTEFKYEIGQILKDEKRDIIIIDRKIVIEERTYKNRTNKSNSKVKYYKYKCNKCGFECREHYKNQIFKEEYWITEGCLTQGSGCSVCLTSPQIVVENINSIVITDPWMIDMFPNGYEEAKKYTKSSNKKIFPICLNCGRISNKQLEISTINKRYLTGCECGDGYKYPPKLMFSMLEQLNINFVTEYNPKWCKFTLKGQTKQRFYDFYFKLNDKEYIVEVDGGWHKIDNKMSGQTKEESKYIDDEKDRLAKEHNIEVIRIDCEKSELEFIKQNILDSKLNEVLDLSSINWKKVEEFALSNRIKEACDLWNSGIHDTKIIAETMKITRKTVIGYLKKGQPLGWCDYDTKPKQIEVFKGGESLGIFESANYLDSESENIFEVKLDYRGISAVCRNERISHKGYTFQYVAPADIIA